MKPQITRGRLITLGILAILAIVFYYLYSYSFLEIQGPADSYTYDLTNQNIGSDLISATATNTVRKLVKRGSYEVLVKQTDKSYWSTVQTKGFLSTSSVKAELVSEHGRTFVGNNPDLCMYYSNGQLLSGPCGGFVEDYILHMPATQKQASYTKQIIGPAAEVEAVLPTSSGTKIVVRAESEDDPGGDQHVAYNLTNAGVLDDGSFYVLGDLDGSQSYTITPYNGGFIAVNILGTEFWHYTDFSQKPKPVTVSRPQDQSLAFRSVTSSDKTLVVTYSNDVTPVNLSDPDGLRVHSKEIEKNGGNNKSDIVVYYGEAEKRINFDEIVVKAIACGNQYICALLATGQMDVYDLSKDSELKFSVSNALDVQMQADKLYVVKSSGVLELTIDSQIGYMVYSFGELRYCGSTSQVNNFVTCIANQDGQRRALLINNAASSSDGIDQKIIKLDENDSIKTVSIFGRYIHISPDLGDPEYLPSLGGFGYDPELKKSVAADIDQQIKSLGIDTNKYLIINPLR